jgi:uncharacterized protein with HEPN domain
MPLDLDAASVLDMVVAGRRIQDFTLGQGYAEFSVDLKTQSAVIHQIMILGEAAKRMSKEFQARHPEVPWSDIGRMRDKLIHHYEGIDPREVWKVASRDVPELLAVLEPLAPEA